MNADYSIAKGSNSLVCLGNVTLASRSCTRLTSPNIFSMPSEDFAQKTRGGEWQNSAQNDHKHFSASKRNRGMATAAGQSGDNGQRDSEKNVAG